jgi:hypothetical protein
MKRKTVSLLIVFAVFALFTVVTTGQTRKNSSNASAANDFTASAVDAILLWNTFVGGSLSYEPLS